MKSRLLYWGAVVALIALGSWIVLTPEPNPHLERAQQLEAQLEEATDRELSREERGELARDFQQAVNNIAPELRPPFWARMQQRFERRQQREMERFFALSDAQRVAELDRRIDEIETRRRQWQSRNGFFGQPVGSSVESIGPVQANADGGRGPWRSDRSEAQAAGGSEDLDESTRRRRAAQAEYFRLLDQRRKERGVPSFGGFRRA